MGIDKAEVIRQLLAAGRERHVLQLMEGESEYTTSDSEGAPLDQRMARLWMAALYHLRFVSEFGVQSGTRTVEGRSESAFPEQFAEWLEAGAVGIGASDLGAYLADHPLR